MTTIYASVPEAGLEPAQPQWPRDFKSLVSTIPPFGLATLHCKGKQFSAFGKAVS